MSDFTRIKFDWGYRDVYKHGFGILEYVNSSGRHIITTEGQIHHDVSCVRAGRTAIRDACKKAIV